MEKRTTDLKKVDELKKMKKATLRDGVRAIGKKRGEYTGKC